MEVSTLKTKKSSGASKVTNENKLGVQLPVGYKPTTDEEFMNPKQIEYFRQKLLRWRAELLDDANQTIANLSTENLHRPDQMDRAQIESNAALDSIARGVVIDLANIVICIARGASSANKVSQAVKGASMPPKAILAINRQP